MKLFFATLTGASAILGTGLLAQPQGPTDVLYIRRAMQEEVAPAIAAIWDIGNAAMNESGGIDPAMMEDAGWAALAAASGRLEATGRAMAAAGTLKAAHEDDWATDEFEVSMDTVQAALDSDPDGFRRFAADFADHAAALKEAASARDAVTTGELVAQMDTECAGCHARYWYAE